MAKASTDVMTFPISSSIMQEQDFGNFDNFKLDGDQKEHDVHDDADFFKLRTPRNAPPANRDLLRADSFRRRNKVSNSMDSILKDDKTGKGGVVSGDTRNGGGGMNDSSGLWANFGFGGSRIGNSNEPQQEVVEQTPSPSQHRQRRDSMRHSRRGSLSTSGHRHDPASRHPTTPTSGADQTRLRGGKRTSGVLSIDDAWSTPERSGGGGPKSLERKLSTGGGGGGGSRRDGRRSVLRRGTSGGSGTTSSDDDDDMNMLQENGIPSPPPPSESAYTPTLSQRKTNRRNSVQYTMNKDDDFTSNTPPRGTPTAPPKSMRQLGSMVSKSDSKDDTIGTGSKDRRRRPQSSRNIMARDESSRQRRPKSLHNLHANLEEEEAVEDECRDGSSPRTPRTPTERLRTRRHRSNSSCNNRSSSDDRRDSSRGRSPRANSQQRKRASSTTGSAPRTPTARSSSRSGHRRRTVAADDQQQQGDSATTGNPPPRTPTSTSRRRRLKSSSDAGGDGDLEGGDTASGGKSPMSTPRANRRSSSLTPRSARSASSRRRLSTRAGSGTMSNDDTTGGNEVADDTGSRPTRPRSMSGRSSHGSTAERSESTGQIPFDADGNNLPQPGTPTTPSEPPAPTSLSDRLKSASNGRVSRRVSTKSPTARRSRNSTTEAYQSQMSGANRRRRSTAGDQRRMRSRSAGGGRRRRRPSTAVQNNNDDGHDDHNPDTDDADVIRDEDGFLQMKLPLEASERCMEEEDIVHNTNANNDDVNDTNKKKSESDDYLKTPKPNLNMINMVSAKKKMKAAFKTLVAANRLQQFAGEGRTASAGSLPPEDDSSKSKDAKQSNNNDRKVPMTPKSPSRWDAEKQKHMLSAKKKMKAAFTSLRAVNMMQSPIENNKQAGGNKHIGELSFKPKSIETKPTMTAEELKAKVEADKAREKADAEREKQEIALAAKKKMKAAFKTLVAANRLQDNVRDGEVEKPRSQSNFGGVGDLFAMKPKSQNLIEYMSSDDESSGIVVQSENPTESTLTGMDKEKMKATFGVASSKPNVEESPNPIAKSKDAISAKKKVKAAFHSLVAASRLRQLVGDGMSDTSSPTSPTKSPEKIRTEKAQLNAFNESMLLAVKLDGLVEDDF